MKKDNIHEGHRQRMMKKVVTAASFLNDHELLEFILFPIIPRKDTNPIAHRLINVFGSLKDVFTCSKEELLTVDGVGERVAAHIMAMGELIKRIRKRAKEEESPQSWISIDRQRKRILSFFKNTQVEKLVIVLLDKDQNEVKTFIFSNHDENSVSVDINDIIEKISKQNAEYVIIMHNHPGGMPYPSEMDDYSVLRFDMFCSANKLILLDSLIIADDEIYSYQRENRLDIIKNTNNLDELYKKFKKELANKEHKWYL